MDREIIAAARDAAAAAGLSGAAGLAGAALVTIVDVKGSAPRHPGAKMLVYASGRIMGTIGGGKGESLAIAAALAAIESRSASFLEVEMLGAETEGKELICGGVNRMLVEYLDDPSPYAAALDALDLGKRVVLQKRLRPGSGSASSGAGASTGTAVFSGRSLELSISVHAEDGEPDIAAAEAAARGKASFTEETGQGGALFLDPLLPEEKLLILGGGHVGPGPRAGRPAPRLYRERGGRQARIPFARASWAGALPHSWRIHGCHRQLPF